MSARWMATRDGKAQFGPYTQEQLTQYILAGQILPTDMLFQEGMTAWAVASSIPTIQGLFAPAPVPPFPEPAPQPAPGPIPYEERFSWWANRFKGNLFPYACPSCNLQIPLRQRVTQTQRTCPGCGAKITVSEIDKIIDASESQYRVLLEQEKNKGCLGVILFSLVLGVGLLVGRLI